jgi:gliding motility-associated-like protein
LSGKAGKTIRLFFKTADCTFRRHFGYAYIDVNSECSGSFVGANYCPDDTLVNVIAPYGYQSYTWYDSTFTSELGTTQTLTLKPAPVSGTKLGVKLEPFNGYGCPSTLFTELRNTLVINPNAGRDTLSCNGKPVPIGAIAKAGLIYQWQPTEGLSNPKSANPFAAPTATTTYTLTTTSSGGGCRVTDDVVVTASTINDSLEVIGKSIFCIDNGDSAVLKVHPTNSIQWYQDGIQINGADQPVYKVTSSGRYYALLKNAEGCTIPTKQQIIVIDKAQPGITYPDEYAINNLPLSLGARKIGQQVLWRPGSNLDDEESFTPVFKGVSETFYTIEIRTNTECLTVDTLLVKVIPNVEIYVPTAFTPNGDGRNDFLRPELRGIKQLRHFRIFNRAGQLVYEKKNGESGWDGIFKGVPLSTQTFVWMLEGIGVDNLVYVRKGASTLIR